MRVWPVVKSIVLMGVLVPTADGQDLVVVDDEIDCVQCAIRLDSVAVLTIPEDRGSIRSVPPLSVVQRESGLFIAGPIAGDGVLAEFSPTGAFSRLFGRAGEGPTEFPGSHLPMQIRLGPDGLLYVLQVNTLLTLQSAEGAVGQRTPLRLRPNDFVLLGSRVIAQSRVLGPGGESSPVQLLAADGTIEAGIGTSRQPPGRPNQPFEEVRRLAAADEESIWIARLNSYELSRFGLDGLEKARLIRSAAWFPEYGDLVPGEPFVTRQRPRIEGVRQDGDGILWVLISQGAHDFLPLSLTSSGEGRLDPYMDFARFLTTTLEAIDIYGGELLSRTEMAGLVRFVDSPRGRILLHVEREGPEGDLYSHVFAATLAR